MGMGRFARCTGALAVGVIVFGMTTASGATASGAVAPAPRRAQTGPAQCRRDGSQMLQVSAGDGFTRLRMTLGESIPARWLTSDSTYRWSQPVPSDRSVLTLRRVARCPDGVVVGVLRAVSAGSSNLSASYTSSLPDPPGYLWNARVTVARRSSPQRAPKVRFAGGGMLVYPRRLDIDGVSTTFHVPRVRCTRGHGFRADIGIDGIARHRPPRTSFAGLTIRCSSHGGRATYRVGVDHRAQLGRVGPGYEVDVSAADTPGHFTLLASAPHSNSSRGTFAGPLLGSLALLGAHVVGDPARPLRLQLQALTVNGLPFRLVPHAVVAQRGVHRHAVTVLGSPNWYRLRLQMS
jgi:hypothetical protein